MDLVGVQLPSQQASSATRLARDRAHP